MDTFDFPFHKTRTQYPNSGDSMQLGNSYESVTKPSAPDQRLFVLNFAAMRYFHNSDGSVNNSVSPQVNYKKFQEFYEAHKLWDAFIYPHPVHGNLVVRFATPLADPEGLTGGDGVTGPFEIQLREQP